ncbi:hypothetical protein Tco_1142503 [Tanacetum coccineum]
MTGNRSYLIDYEEIDGGFVAFGGSTKGGKITRNGKISTCKLDFKDVYFVKELKFNLFSVSQMCDKKNNVLFTYTECVILSPDFKLLDESHVLLKVPRKDNMYSIDFKNIVPLGGLTCLFAKATLDESNLWHMRLGHINFKTMNKLVRGNLVRGLPLNFFENDHTCVACQKGKQHKASCKTKTVRPRLGILKAFIIGIGNLIDHKVKIIRCDNGTKFKNKEMNQFCEKQGIKREFSIARTSQQNGVAKRKNRTLIEAARTMLDDLKLHTTFWLKQLILLVMYKIGCPVTILNTLDHLGKFDRKADEGFFVRYSVNRKAFRVFNSRTRIVEETLHITFLENKPNVAGSGPEWLFYIDTLTKSMNYKPVVAGNQSNGNAGTKACDDAGKARMETVPGKDYILLPLWPKDASVNSTNSINTVSSFVNAAGIEDNDVDGNIVYGCADDPNMPHLEEIGRFSDAEDDTTEADMNNLDTYFQVNLVPTTRIHKHHPLEQINRDLHSAPQTRRMTKNLEEHGLFSSVQQRTNHKDFQNCLFACFLSQAKPKKVIQALKDPSWIEAMQEELLQFKLQHVWTLVDLPHGKRAIGTKWVYRNKKDERCIMIRKKARLVIQGYTQEDGIDYDEVFALVARIEAIRLFLAYASFKDFVVYQMDVKSAFLYGKIEEEVYVCQPPGFEDPVFPDRVYKVEKALYVLHQAPRAWNEMCTEFEKMMHKKFQMSSMGELTFFLGLQVTQKDDGIFISQDKYVDEILKKFGFSTMKTASTPMETSKPLMKDENAEDVDVHLYRSMIGSLMYLTSSRPNIIFVVYACARFQVTPKVSHLHVVKGIFRYLKGQPKMGLWYPKDSPFDLKAYTNSDYAGASLDRKSTTGDSEYVATSNCYGQVLWIQNQMLDYGYNFMNTKIFIHNESTICIVKNLVFHSKTKHIEIRHHFIRDSYEKRLIQVIKIHTDHNVADLLTKAFDVSRFQYLIARWLEWNAKTTKDEIEVKTGNSKVNAVGHYLVLLGETVFNDEYDTPSHTKKVFANITRKGKDFSRTVTPLFPSMMASQTVEGKGLGQPTKPQHIPTIASPSHSSGPTTLVADETVHQEKRDRMERVSTTASSLEAEQDSDNIIRTQSMATLNEPIPQGTGSCSGPRRQDTILRDRPAQTRFERLSKQSNDPPLSRVNTLGSGEDIMKLNELMEIYTRLSKRVLSLENTKTAQDLEIINLKKRIKKLEKKKKSRTLQLKRRLFKFGIESSTEKSLGDHEDASKQGRNEIDHDEGISWFQEDAETQGRYGHDIEINTASTSITTASINITTAELVTTASALNTTASVSVSTAAPGTPPTTTTLIEDEDLIIAQTLMKMRSVKSKEKSKEKGVSSTRLTRGVIIKEASETTTRPIVPPQQQLDPKDKGKCIMKEPEKPMKVKGEDQIEYDAGVAQRLQAELDEEARLEREREEEASNAALIEE